VTICVNCCILHPYGRPKHYFAPFTMFVEFSLNIDMCSGKSRIHGKGARSYLSFFLVFFLFFLHLLIPSSPFFLPSSLFLLFFLPLPYSLLLVSCRRRGAGAH
jgi:pilus assembly protein TadC